MRRPASLLAYLSLAALRAPAVGRKTVGDADGGDEAGRLAERQGQPGHARPEGPLVWLHASGLGQDGALADLARRIGEAQPQASFLLTSDTVPDGLAALPPRTVHQLIPEEATRPVAGFLDHWRPDVVLWAGAVLRPALVYEASQRGALLALIDAALAPQPERGWRRFAGLASATLRRFNHVLATDEGAAEALIGAGASKEVVEITGPLEEEAATLPCSMRERDAIGLVLKARPVWLAVSVPEAEEAAVIAAHRWAARLAHRLLLILAPADPARGPALAAQIAESGLSVALRTVEGEPEASTEVFVADSEGELGLWYRLAPVSFMGGTLDPGSGGGRSPLEPAALGSAILHGQHTGPNAALYDRFWAAEAARGVTDGADLGETLSELQSPDKAAAMAHAAWRVSTGGADMSERVLALVAEALAARGAR